MRFALQLAAAIVASAPGASSGSSACNVALTKQLSATACVRGSSFGCYPGNAGSNKTMWAKGGCRGMFTCDGTPTE